jgi:hypothetical protein
VNIEIGEVTFQEIGNEGKLGIVYIKKLKN